MGPAKWLLALMFSPIVELLYHRAQWKAAAHQSLADEQQAEAELAEQKGYYTVRREDLAEATFHGAKARRYRREAEWLAGWRLPRKSATASAT